MNIKSKSKAFLFAGLFLAVVSVEAKAQFAYPSFADLADKVLPTVVNISIKNSDNSENYYNQDLNKHEALGSGFIIDEQGYIATNNHVIDKADIISVTLSDNTTLDAKLIGKDNKLDIAVIKVDTNKKLSPVKFGNSDKIRIGEWILAIGNPFGLGGSVTAGIVSAKSRDIESGPYDNFIQTDASINQGNSGGPMFNMDGEVIGINTAIFSTTGNSMGVGFAVPSNLALWSINQIKENGEVKRGWIGIKIQPNTPEIAQSLGLNENQGVIVSSVTENSAAQKAGIEAGDVILSFDNQPIDNTKNLSRSVAEIKIGKIVPVEIWRNKQKIQKNVLIEEMPIEPEIQTKKPIIEEDKNISEDFLLDNIGISISNINADNMDKYSLRPETKGIIVTNIEAGSDADIKGLKKGDIIVKIDKKTVLDIDDANAFVNEAKLENNRPVLFQIQNAETPHFVAVKLKSNE